MAATALGVPADERHCSGHQRGAAEVVPQVDLSAVPYQQLDHSLVAVVGGAHQRGPAVAPLQVDLRAAQQQQLDHPLVALLDGVHPRGDAAQLARHASRVDPPAAVEPRQQRRLVAFGSPAIAASEGRLPSKLDEAASLTPAPPYVSGFRLFVGGGRTISTSTLCLPLGAYNFNLYSTPRHLSKVAKEILATLCTESL